VAINVLFIIAVQNMWVTMLLFYMKRNLFSWKTGGHERHNTETAKDLQFSCTEHFLFKNW